MAINCCSSHILGLVLNSSIKQLISGGGGRDTGEYEDWEGEARRTISCVIIKSIKSQKPGIPLGCGTQRECL